MELLERHFEIALETPDGIKKLRELILLLAMQGKLVPQDPDDQPASELLKEIEAEKKRLVKEGKIKKQEPLPPIKPDEIPYKLPKGWEWVRLDNYGTWKSGSTPSRNNSSYYGGEIPWVKSGEVKQGRIVETSELITQTALENCSLAINPRGSVLIAMYGANIGEVGVLEIEATTNQAVCACKTYSNIFNLFLFQLLKSLKSSFISQGAGAAQPNISREKIINQVVPLPPLAEQSRIVAKIDQLMALCDKLEIERNKRNQKRFAMHAAAMNKLLSAPDNTTFNDSWEFITKNFSELYSVPENVQELKKAILQLAVMGKLVPQDSKDQPASELLKEVEAEKKKLIREGKIRKQEPLPPIKPEEIPYEVPKGWEWVRLGSVSNKITDGTHHSPINTEVGEYKYISAKNIKNEGVDLSNITYVTKEIHQEIYIRCNPQKGDILYIKDGATTGIVTINNLEDEFSMLSSVALIKLPKGLLPTYLVIVMRSPSLYESIRNDMSGVAITRITLKKINDVIIPLPPITEQKRIVAKVNQLMELCKTLEQQIKHSTNKQMAILNAVLTKV